MTTDITRAEQTRSRIAALQTWLVEAGYDGLFVPRTDFWQGEEVMACDERLLWLTGFSGSDGMALVLCDAAAVFADGRYTIQAADELQGSSIISRHITNEPWHEWNNLPVHPRLAVDAKLVTGSWVEQAKKILEQSHGEFILLDSNPVDTIWEDQPAPQFTPVSHYPVALAGEDSLSKRQRLAAQLKAQGQQAALITDPTAIAWLLNIRAQDYLHTPVALSVALLRDDATVIWFTTPERDTPELRQHVGEGCKVATPAAWGEIFTTLNGQTVLVDEATAAVWLEQKLVTAGAIVQRSRCLTAMARAQKNAVELDGMQNAHRRDGVAMARFLKWYDTTVAPGTAALTESDIAGKLASERGRSNEYRGASFTTICGFGAHGAIVHYHTTAKSDVTVTGDTLLLLDSGGQYNDGTTDITRTLPVGAPNQAQREAYTRVLKGHVALASARFPAGTTGHQLDALARAPLWQAGMDYDHGTGHGVGHFLSVHEGPQSISKRLNKTELQPGMVLSNEPGSYEEDAYGIRIETLVAVRESQPGAGGKPFLEFQTLTLVPYARTLIVVDMLTIDERRWIDAYHARVLREIGPQLEGENLQWLQDACSQLS